MFQKAAELAPYRLDLKYDVAYAKILQSKVEDAL